jgi:hypothetical protein
MKQFDEKFRQQAKDAFSGYDAGHLADAGWNAFVQKRKRRGIAGIVIPLWAKAATVALLLTTGSLITYRIIDSDPATVTGGTAYETVTEETPSLQQSRGEPTAPAVAEAATTEPAAIEKSSAGRRSDGVERLAVSTTTVRVTAEGIVTDPAVATYSVKRAEAVQALVEAAVVAATDAAVLVAEADVAIVPEQLAETIPDEVTVRTRRTFLMAGMAGNMARAEDIPSGVPGVSFGVYGEHRISRKWAVRQGIVLAMHTVGLGSPTVAENMIYTAPVLDGASGSIESFEGSLQLLAMEVPVNFVYTVMERGKRGLYVSAGASTMVYLNQNVSGSFTNSYMRQSYNTTTGELASETRYSSVGVESSEEPFSHTDVFGLANFSAGYSMPFGKSSKLLIEPYMQLPVSTLTSLNLRIRYGGVALKIRFGK